MLKLVTFDLDGTIIDDEWAHARAKTEIARSFGAVGDLDLEYYVGRSNRLFWAHVVEKFGLPEQDIENLVSQQFALVAKYVQEAKQPEAPGLTELLNYLKQNGYTTAVTSGSDVSFVDAILEYLGVLDLFDVKVTKNDVHAVKPDPDIYLVAQRFAGIEGCHALGIEDSTSGCLALNRAGMLSVGFTDNGKNPQDLSQADYIVDTMLDLIPIIERIQMENK